MAVKDHCGKHSTDNQCKVGGDLLYVQEYRNIFQFCDQRLCPPEYRCPKDEWFNCNIKQLVPVVRRVDVAIHQINRYPADKC